MNREQEIISKWKSIKAIGKEFYITRTAFLLAVPLLLGTSALHYYIAYDWIFTTEFIFDYLPEFILSLLFWPIIAYVFARARYRYFHLAYYKIINQKRREAAAKQERERLHIKS